MSQDPPTRPTTDAAATRIAVVVSRYNATITDRLLEGALEAYRADAAAGGAADGVTVVEAPGAFELPALALAAARSGRFDGVVALGCLIRGETRHDRYIAEAVAHGLVQVTVATGVHVAFGVLTVDTPEQAADRAGGAHGNKGAEAMNAALETVRAVRRIDGRATGGDAPRASAPRPDKALKHAAGVTGGGR